MRQPTQRSIERRTFLRLAAAGAGGLALPGLLAACGAPPADPSQPPGFTEVPLADAARVTPTGLSAPATSQSEKTTIVLGHWDGALRPLLAEFERANPDVQVRFIPSWTDDYHRGLRSALASGDDIPDVAAISLSWLGVFAERGGFADLTSPPFDGGRLAGEMVPAVWEAGQVNGRQIAVPWSIYPAAMWYRPELLADAGIAADPQELARQAQSWDDLLGLAQALKEAKPERSLFFDARDLFYVGVAQQEYGWLDGNKVLIEEKGTRPAQLAALSRARKLDADLVSGNPDLAIRNNQLVGVFADPTLLPFLAERFVDLSGGWRLVPPPGGPAIYGASFLAVTEQSQQQELAWELVKFLAATPGTQNAYFGTGGGVPAYRPAWADKLYEAPVEFFGGQAVNRVWADMVAAMPAVRLSAHQLSAVEVVETELGQVTERDKDPVQAMLDAEAAIIRKAEGLTN
jgi:ABC-type glycerol-3-phosphate transport system substrate-binding protein